MAKQLLIIGFVWPEPKSTAAGSRLLQLIALFQSEGYGITFASASSQSDKSFCLEQLKIKSVSIVLNDDSFDTFVSELNPDVVLFDRFMTEEQYGWRVAEQCPNALRVLDTEDLHALRKGREQAYKAQVEFTKKHLFNTLAKREIASIYRCDLSIMISEVEVDILKNNFKLDANLLCYLPFLVQSISEKTKQNLLSFEARQHFVTIGNFLHAPNYDAVLYLKQTLWKAIRKQLPKAEMHIYGAYASQKVEQLHNEKDGFLIKGYAEQVGDVMQTARLCLAPLRFGAGLKGKMIDAMLNGTPCITTSIGAEGLFGDLQPNGFVENNPEQFVEKAVTLYNDAELWKQSQNNGFQTINNRFSETLFKTDFLNTIETLQNNLEAHRLSNFTGQMLQHHSLQSTKFMSKWIEEKNKV